MRSTRRSGILVVIGVLVFVVGAGVAVLAARAAPHRASTSPPARSVPTKLEAGAPRGLSTPTPEVLSPAASTGLLPIPKGAVALAVQLPSVEGMAGYVHAGEAVDVFGVAKNVPQGPVAKLVLSGVEVLAVSGVSPGASTGTETYVLALTPEQAEHVVYLASFEGLYLALAHAGAPGVPTTGVNPTNALGAS